MKRLMTTNKPVMKIQNLIMNHESRYVKLNHALVSKHLNPMVHRMTFHTIKQDNTESIQDFLIHIQAASVVLVASMTYLITTSVINSS